MTVVQSSTRILSGLVVCLSLLPSLIASSAPSPPKSAEEYEIKAAYLYKFLMFVDWPTQAPYPTPGADQPPSPITIGIVGDDPFSSSFSEVENTVIRHLQRRLEIRRFGSFDPSIDLSHCDLVFVCRSEKARAAKITAQLAGKPVLTVADMPGFLEAGGMMNLVLDRKRIRWEIAIDAMRAAGLKPKAQLVGSAVRVVGTGEVSEPTTKAEESDDPVS